MSMEIDWRKIKKTSEGDRNEFEHFCDHIFARHFSEIGIYERFYNTPGSESYIEVPQSIQYKGVELASGDVIGLQAKFWLGTNDDTFTPINSKRIEELKKCFETTVRDKPNVKIWIICTPGALQETTWTKIKHQLSSIKSDCTFISWHKEVFQQLYLSNSKLYNGIFHYYFSGNFIETSIIDTITKDTFETLKQKYDVDLHVPSEVEHSLLSVVDSKIANNLLKTRIRSIVEAVRNDMKYHNFTSSMHWCADLPKELLERCDHDIRHRCDFVEQLATYIDTDNVVLHVENMVPMLQQYIEQYQQLKAEIAKLVKQLLNKLPKHEKERISWSIHSIIERITELEEPISGSPEKALSLIQIVGLITQKVHSIFAEPGYGKTHLACSIANSLMSRKQPLPVLLLLGTRFRTDKDLDEVFTNLLRLPIMSTLDDAMDVLDFIGECNHCKLSIIIDGMNESAPHDDRWLEDLPKLQRRINERKHLLLITTCRSQIDYLQTIYGCSKISEIPCSYELGGLVLANMEIAISKYFKKYDIEPNSNPNIEEFTNPLLLKMFCEVNKGKKQFDLYGTSLTNCMQTYSEHMLDKIARTAGRGFRIRKCCIEKGLGDLAQKIWDHNHRQIRLIDMNEFFSVASDLNALIDEGCFTIERHGADMFVQFSYDMIAGYYVARHIVSTYSTKECLCEYIALHINRLYGEKRHTYAQDIIKNLLYLIPQKYGIQWCQLMPTIEIISSTIENIDNLLSADDNAHALHWLMNQCLMDNALKLKLCNRIYHRITVEHNLSKFSYFIPFFQELTPSELDQYWNSFFIEYSVLNRMENLLHDEYVVSRYLWKDVISCNIMLCGIVIHTYKERYHTLLFFHILQHYNDISMSLLKDALMIRDYAIFESMVSILTGVAIRKGELDCIDAVIAIMEEYMQGYSSNCVLLLDALDTLYSYAENKCGIVYDRFILSKNQLEEWSIIPCRDLDLFCLYDYDFEKFNIRPLYEKHCYTSVKQTPYSREEISGMLLARCQRNGYDEQLCVQLNNKLRDVKYRRAPELNFGYKYGRFALMELYGWLLLNGMIDPLFSNTFRVELFDIDPTMPLFPTKWNFVNSSFMPDNVEKLSEWIEQDDTQAMEQLLVRKLPNMDGEWVLLQGRLHQHIDDKYAIYFISGYAELVSNSLPDDAIQSIPTSDPITMSHVYAGELGWRVLDNCDVAQDEDNRCLLAYYDFTNWSGSRYSYRGIEYLRTEWMLKLGLRFDVNTMTYYDENSHVASAYFVNDSDLFLYLRKDILDKLLRITDSALRLHIYERRMISREIPKEKDCFPNTYEQHERDVIYRIDS